MQIGARDLTINHWSFFYSCALYTNVWLESTFVLLQIAYFAKKNRWCFDRQSSVVHVPITTLFLG